MRSWSRRGEQGLGQDGTDGATSDLAGDFGGAARVGRARTERLVRCQTGRSHFRPKGYSPSLVSTGDTERWRGSEGARFRTVAATVEDKAVLAGEPGRDTAISVRGPVAEPETAAASGRPMRVRRGASVESFMQSVTA